ncbi:IscS subfamily cysteine desulfurase [soil metagenome]
MRPVRRCLYSFSITVVMIYLDYAATTPMSKTALDAYQQAATRFFGNSNSLHDAGSNASGALESSRKLFGTLLGVPHHGIHFTGSGSEAAFHSLYGLAMAAKKSDSATPHIITSRAEHSCIRNTCAWLSKHHGFDVSYISSLENGTVNLDELKNELRPETILVSIQHVNSETGAINPLKEISDLLSGHNASFHSDCVQSFCKLEINPIEWSLDSISISAHKVHGPKGLGATYINPKKQWAPFITETNQEHGFRHGTVDVPAVVAFAVAAREQIKERDSNYNYVHSLKQHFIQLLKENCGDLAIIEGDPENCSPFIAGVRLRGMEGQFAMLQCSQKGIGISTGSACQVNEQKPSATMKAMGREDDDAKQFVRFSFDASTTMQEIEKGAEILSNVLKSHLEYVKF